VGVVHRSGIEMRPFVGIFGRAKQTSIGEALLCAAIGKKALNDIKIIVTNLF